MSIILTIIGTGITVISATFGFYHYRKNIKIEQLRIFEALLLHKLSAQALGAIQGNNSYSKMLENISGEGTIKKIIYDIGLSEGYCQSLFIETAKMFCSLNNISIKDIDNMINIGHLSKEYRNIYVSFAKMGKKETKKQKMKSLNQ
jgi:hypothetical protein